MKLAPPATVKAYAGKTGFVKDSGEVVTPGSGKEFYLGRFRKVGS
jgi:hypothetical protein